MLAPHVLDRFDARPGRRASAGDREANVVQQCCAGVTRFGQVLLREFGVEDQAGIVRIVRSKSGRDDLTRLHKQVSLNFLRDRGLVDRMGESEADVDIVERRC